MNLIECYITKVIYEKPYNFKKYCKNKELLERYKDKEFLEVCFEYDCCGSKSLKTGIYTKDEWESIKEKGYFMG